VENSILKSVKKMVGVNPDDPDFDLDILNYINGTFAVLDQIGVGPDGGFMIEDASTAWDAFLGPDPRLNMIKTFVYLRVRHLFDPPGTSYLIAANEKQMEELIFRISVGRENSMTPRPGVLVYGPQVVDGGNAYRR
jgi:hypothetical protein